MKKVFLLVIENKKELHKIIGVFSDRAKARLHFKNMRNNRFIIPVKTSRIMIAKDTWLIGNDIYKIIQRGVNERI